MKRRARKPHPLVAVFFVLVGCGGPGEGTGGAMTLANAQLGDAAADTERRAQTQLEVARARVRSVRERLSEAGASAELAPGPEFERVQAELRAARQQFSRELADASNLASAHWSDFGARLERLEHQFEAK